MDHMQITASKAFPQITTLPAVEAENMNRLHIQMTFHYGRTQASVTRMS